MEYLILREDGLPLVLPQAAYMEALRPMTLSCRVVPGWGAHRIEVKGCPIVFAFGETGVSVTFQNWLLTDDEVERVVNEIALNISRAVNAPTKVVEN
jgi:hypothetical protein